VSAARFEGAIFRYSGKANRGLQGRRLTIVHVIPIHNIALQQTMVLAVSQRSGSGVTMALNKLVILRLK